MQTWEEGGAYKLNFIEPPNVFKIFDLIVNIVEVQYIAYTKSGFSTFLG